MSRQPFEATSVTDNLSTSQPKPQVLCGNFTAGPKVMLVPANTVFN